MERSRRLSLKMLEELEFSGRFAAWIGPETWGSGGGGEGGVGSHTRVRAVREENIQRMGSMAPWLGLY